MTYKQIINKSIKACDSAGVYSGFARFLMVELLREKDMELYDVLDEVCDPDIAKDYEAKMARILNDEPMGYVLGYSWFYNYKIMVNENVLIPREETEELVGEILMAIDERYYNPVIIDVATGSGAIAIALASEVLSTVYATDISKEALEVAQENAHINNARVTFYEGDMLEPAIEQGLEVDVLVCNPPYIKNTEHIQHSVLTHEPHVALFGGEDGLYFYRKVFENAHKMIKPNGMMAFEIGFDIGEAVCNLAKESFPNAQVELKQDLNGLDRMVFVFLGV
ncbi:protein-(glutamine-N5) methyltransferase, release factor-specific [Erysipelothrix larvae]|uniref:Protein-(Glutamine-N5) methyltransferase, release factor-specific n=2 Tax=Erysipelothrix larvae TaxID=1514105 RepID=A0A0X8H241_9FIRM|nr:protein-(glutamine-N5) methyltransferase, release factor-specific [Erysipelothrix larvae]